MLGRIIVASADSVMLALDSLRQRRYEDAMDYAYEAWGLKHSHQGAAVGLLAAAALRNGVEIARWLRRRRLLDEASGM